MIVANIIEESRLGGPQIRITRVAEHLKKLNVKTIVFMPKNNSEDFYNLCKKKKIKAEIINISNIEKNFLSILKYIFFFIFDIFEITKKIKNHDIDLIHISGGSWQIKGVIAGKLLNKPTIWHINDTSMPWFVVRLFKILSKLSTGLIFASKKSHKFYGNNENIPYSIVPSALDSNFFNKENTSIFQSDLDINDKRVLVTVANISPVKNFECLIHCIKNLKEKIKNIHLFIIGDTFKSQNSYKNKIENLINKFELNKNITFLGKKKDTRFYLKMSEIYVCSSNFESSPISIWEAMSMELPIVSTKVGDIKNYIEDDKNGYVVNKNDYKTMSDKLFKLLNNRQQMINFGLVNRKIAINNFSLDIISKKTIDFYNLILDKY